MRVSWHILVDSSTTLFSLFVSYFILFLTQFILQWKSLPIVSIVTWQPIIRQSSFMGMRCSLLCRRQPNNRLPARTADIFAVNAMKLPLQTISVTQPSSSPLCAMAGTHFAINVASERFSAAARWYFLHSWWKFLWTLMAGIFRSAFLTYALY